MKMMRYILCALLMLLPFGVSARNLQADIVRLEELAKQGKQAEFRQLASQMEETGLPEAMVRLGKLYEHLPTVHLLPRADYATAAEYYTKALRLVKDEGISDEWTTRAQRSLASLYMDGRGVRADGRRAEILLKQAIAAGDKVAAYEYGQLLETGAGNLGSNMKAAAEQYRLAIQRRYGKAALALARLYRQGLVPAPSRTAAQDMAILGVSYLEEAAKKGEGDAAYRLAQAFADGEGVAADQARALIWFEEAMKNNHIGALMTLSDMYGRGITVAVDRKKATDYMRRAAEQGSVAAAEAMGSSRSNNKRAYLDVPKEEADQWLRRAAAVGSGEATRSLAFRALETGNSAQAVAYLEPLANNGDVTSALTLSSLFDEGRLIIRDEAKAALYFNKAKESAISASDKWRIARIMVTPSSHFYDRQEGLKWMTQAGEEGNTKAVHYLAGYYDDADDPKTSFYWNRKAANRGNVSAMLRVASALTEGRGTIQDTMLGSLYVHRALKNISPSDGRAMMQVANAYRTGTGVERNIARSVEWLEKAIKLGETKAKVELARIALWDVVEGYTQADAIRLFHEAEAAGIPEVQLELGLSYAGGRGVPMSSRRAVHYFTEAARADIPQAWHELGAAYLNGIGVPRNTAKGRDYIARAAEKQYPEAMVDLALIYLHGPDGYRDAGKGILWLKRAADKGHRDAIYWLAKAYQRGEGVPRDAALAGRLLEKAAAEKHPLARIEMETKVAGHGA